jgi:hypothetical protein
MPAAAQAAGAAVNAGTVAGRAAANEPVVSTERKRQVQ